MISPLISRLWPVPLLLLALPAAHAGDEAGPGTPSTPGASIATTVTFASQYVSRGMRQTWGRPALQLGVDYAHPSGWSAGRLFR